jgi:hypothetical protein
MKAVKLSLVIMAAALLTIGLGGMAYAFHSGGVGECEGCHTMHNSFENASTYTKGTQFQAGVYLLKGTDQSSACLNCHNSADTAPSGYHVSTDESKLGVGLPPVEMTPGGDFAWLKKTYNITIRGTTTVNGNLGERHGHNIIAADYNYVQDAKQIVAPGGNNYPAANLACSSCHDPHGKYRRFADGSYGTTGLPIFNSGSYGSVGSDATKYPGPTAGTSAVGSYRLLAGVGYQPKSLSGSFAFTAPTPPDAAVNSAYNRSELTGQTHVAYGKGMSEWCANCHTQMLQNGFVSGQNHSRHPAGNSANLSAAIVANYNSYVSSGVMTNTDPTKAYSTLAPFELGTNNYTILRPLAANTDTLNQSASTSATVSCLSCHRAHASAFESMTRYFLNGEFMTIADASNVAIYDPSTTENKNNYGYNQQEQTNAYYGRPATVFGPYARNFCNKCHAKD